MIMMETTKELLKKVKSGEKRGEIRNFFKDIEGEYVGLRAGKSGKAQLILKIGPVFDLTQIPEDEKNYILDDCFISKAFRKRNSCNYLYTIAEVHNIN